MVLDLTLGGLQDLLALPGSVLKSALKTRNFVNTIAGAKRQVSSQTSSTYLFVTDSVAFCWARETRFFGRFMAHLFSESLGYV